MCFCLQLDKLKHIFHEEFGSLNWLPVTYKLKQCVSAIIFTYFSAQYPNDLNEIFDVAKIKRTHSSVVTTVIPSITT